MTRFLSFKWILTFILIAITGYLYSKDGVITTSVVATAVIFGLPLALAAMVGIMCERTGIVNIGIEGTLLFSSFIGFFVASSTNNGVFGIISAITAGVVTGSSWPLCLFHGKWIKLLLERSLIFWQPA